MSALPQSLDDISIPKDDKIDVADLMSKLGDRMWRLNNLYWIKDKPGNRIKFILNRAQRRLLKRLHNRNVILKARQIGFSTFIQIFMLDVCLFNSNISAGVIAQDRETAENIFNDRIKFAFDNLPEVLRDELSPTQDTVRKMRFKNGSSIIVGTSLRGGTYQLLHVSEYGKISARYQAKAVEIKTGSMETVPIDGIIFVESTGEGREGEFFTMVKDARDLAAKNRKLDKLEFAFHFFPWLDDPSYVMDATNILIVPALKKYFENLETKFGISLTMEQKAWYVAKARTLGAEMKREHPSHPDEPFEVALVGAYYTSQFQWLRENDRITKVPHNPALPIITAWDTGVGDYTSIWFLQILGRQVNVIDFFEDSGEELAYYARILDERRDTFGYRYTRHIGPHDLEARGRWDARKGVDVAKEAGLTFDVIPAVSVNSTIESIEPVRQFLRYCWFDEEKCDKGIKALEAYRKEWDENLQTYKDRPLHDWSSHAAKAFECAARGDIFGATQATARQIKPRKIAI